MRVGIAAPPATALFLPFRKTISARRASRSRASAEARRKNPFFIPAAGGDFLVALAGGFAEGPEPEGADDARPRRSTRTRSVRSNRHARR